MLNPRFAPKGWHFHALHTPERYGGGTLAVTQGVLAAHTARVPASQMRIGATLISLQAMGAAPATEPALQTAASSRADIQ